MFELEVQSDDPMISVVFVAKRELLAAKIQP